MTRAARARIKELFSDNLWLLPAVTAIAAVAAGKLLGGLDRRLAQEDEVWYMFGGQADSAREVLSTIASSLMMFISVVFSITILVLQLASSQFSPRVLRTFLSNKVTRASMVTFIGSFVYALVVLTEVRADGPGGSGFVPRLSIFVAFLLVLTSVGMFVRYIHEMAHSIRAIHIIRQVADETRRTIDRVYTEKRRDGSRPILREPELFSGGRLVSNGGYPGVLSAIDEEGLVGFAARHNLLIELLQGVGDFVPRGAPLARISEETPIDREELCSYLVLSEERMPGADPMFGFRQLVDIAVRALSPGINDPTTAVQALDQIHDLLRALVARPFPEPVLHDDAGQARLFLRAFDWDAYLHLAFDEIRLAGESSIHVTQRMRAIVDDLSSVAPPPRRAPLRRQRELLDRAVRRGFPDVRERALASAPEARDA